MVHGYLHKQRSRVRRKTMGGISRPNRALDIEGTETRPILEIIPELLGRFAFKAKLR